MINLRDNLLRDKIGDEIVNALKINTNLVRVMLELNPVKHAILKEVGYYTKRNWENLKEEAGPSIRNEILSLKEKKEDALIQCKNHDESLIGYSRKFTSKFDQLC